MLEYSVDKALDALDEIKNHYMIPSDAAFREWEKIFRYLLEIKINQTTITEPSLKKIISVLEKTTKVNVEKNKPRFNLLKWIKGAWI